MTNGILNSCAKVVRETELLATEPTHVILVLIAAYAQNPLI